MQPLALPDSRCVLAAIGWLELVDHIEANEELERITPAFRTHPDVLEVRWQVYAVAKKWDVCLDIGQAVVKLDPKSESGWIHRKLYRVRKKSRLDQ